MKILYSLGECQQMDGWVSWLCILQHMSSGLHSLYGMLRPPFQLLGGSL